MLDQIKTGESEFLVEAQLQVLKMKKIWTPEGSLYVDLVLRDITGAYPHFRSKIEDDSELAKFKVGNVLRKDKFKLPLMNEFVIND